jgi:6-phosphogluconolactonase
MLMMRSESIQAAAVLLAEQVAAALRNAVQARGAASLLVPGGRTPVPFFRELRRHDIPWRQILVSLTDERWVPADHADSNARLVRDELLADAAAVATFIPLHNPASTASQGAAECWRGLALLPRPFDVVVLGMGDDGHFASLFPHSPGLAAALDLKVAAGCLAMRAPAAPVDRISLNLAALANARQLYLFITGEKKLAQIASAGMGDPLPINALLALREPEPVVCWAP